MADFNGAADGGAVATDSIWAAAGDIVYATADDTASVLSVGSNNDILQLSSGIPDWTCAPTLTGLTIACSGVIELGHACDTTLARASAGEVNIQGNRIYRACGTDVAVADGGTNLSSYTAGDVLYASGTTALSKLAKPCTPAGQVLTFAACACAPSWVAASGGTSLSVIIALT